MEKFDFGGLEKDTATLIGNVQRERDAKVGKAKRDFDKAKRISEETYEQQRKGLMQLHDREIARRIILGMDEQYALLGVRSGLTGFSEGDIERARAMLDFVEGDIERARSGIAAGVLNPDAERLLRIYEALEGKDLDREDIVSYLASSSNGCYLVIPAKSKNGIVLATKLEEKVDTILEDGEFVVGAGGIATRTGTVAENRTDRVSFETSPEDACGFACYSLKPSVNTPEYIALLERAIKLKLEDINIQPEGFSDAKLVHKVEIGPHGPVEVLIGTNRRDLMCFYDRLRQHEGEKELSYQDAADVLGLQKVTIEKRIKKGTMEGGEGRVPYSAVERAIREQEAKELGLESIGLVGLGRRPPRVRPVPTQVVSDPDQYKAQVLQRLDTQYSGVESLTDVQAAELLGKATTTMRTHYFGQEDRNEYGIKKDSVMNFIRTHRLTSGGRWHKK